MKNVNINSHFLVGLFFLALIGCVSNVPNSNLVEIDEANVKNVENFNLSEITDSCLYVKLETNDSCLIGEIRDIQYSDAKIFVLNSVQGDKEVLVFDKSGRFINKIGIKGAGPGEYIAISGMGINSVKKQVILMDPMKLKVHTYDYYGHFIESKPVKESCAFIYKVSFISNNKIRCISSVNSVTSELICDSKEDLGDSKVLLKTKFSNSGGFIFAKNPISNNGNCFISPMSEIIYQSSDGVLDSTYTVNLNNQYQKVDELKGDNYDFNTLFVEAIKNGFEFLNGISESKNLLIIQQLHYTILWDKKNKKGLNLSNTTSKPTQNDLSIHSHCTISGFENGFLVSYSNEDLLRMINFYQGQGIRPNKEIEKFLSGISINDNPYLCLYMFK